jgi:uncharacterized protein YgiM (DUF1202 family)
MGSKILNVPYKSQNDADANLKHTDCGPCCIAMILGAAGQTVTTNAIVAASGMSGDNGLMQSQVVNAAKAFGLTMAWQAGYTLDDLKKFIDNGQPPIALIKYANLPDRLDRNSTGGHYVVAIGYDDATQRVFINDPDYFPGTAGGYQKAYAYTTWLSAWGGFAAGENTNFCLIAPQLSTPVPGQGVAAPAAPTAATGNVWVIAPAGLTLRTQASTSGAVVTGLVFGQKLVALGAESTVSGGLSWQQVQTDSGLSGFVAASLNGDRLLAKQQPSDPYIVQVIDAQPIRDAGGLAVRNGRDITLGPIDRVQPNERMTVYQRRVEQDGTPWLWVQSPRNQYGWARESSQGVTLVSKVTPDLGGQGTGATPEPPRNIPTPVATTADAWVNTSDGLNLRSQSNPSANLIDTIPFGEHVTTIGPRLAADANNIVWQQVRRDNAQAGWVAAVLQGTELLSATQPAAPPTPVSVVPWGKSYAGLGMGNPQPLTPGQLILVSKSKMEAFKTLTLPDPDQNKQLIQQLRNIRSDMFIVTRLFFSVDAGNRRKFSPQEFVDFCNNGMTASYQAGVRYFEVHNEPNLLPEGMGFNWNSGSEFGSWLTQVINLLRQRFPEGKFGYPGLSPQPNVPSFLDGSTAAIAQCDWVGVHCYWQSADQPPFPMTGDNAGMYWRQFRQRFPDKLLMITEFSNNTAAISDSDKGRQYARYYQLLRHEANVGAAFSFALNWPGQDNNREGWEFNGHETNIPGTIGALIGQGNFLA